MPCPPVTMDTLDLAELDRPLLYIRLHGVQGQPYLYGDDWTTALSAEQIGGVSLPRSLVFLEGCYGLQFAEAFLTAGALAVIGCDEPTFGRRWFPGPSSIIGRKWLLSVRAGKSAGEALSLAIGRRAAQWKIAGNEKARLT